jgi:hypothetical protein
MTDLTLLNENPGHVSGLDYLLREIGRSRVEDLRYQEVMTALATAAQDKNTAEYIMDKLVSAFFFAIQDDRDGSICRYASWDLIKAEHPDDGGERIDAAYFLPLDICKALPKLENLAPEFQAALTAAAKTVFQKLPVENLAILLLSADTPAWLGKVILCNKRFLDLLSSAVNIPVNIRLGLYDDSASNDEQKVAEMRKTFEQTAKALEWLDKCPPEFLPVSIDPYPPDLLEYAAIRAGKMVHDLPPDKLLAISSLNIFPAWFRKAAENRFQELTASVTANNPDRPKRHRRRGPADIQPQKTNGSENL